MTIAAFLIFLVALLALAWFLAYHRANGLAWSFMLAVGVSAAALAVGSYVVVRHNLLADSVHDSARQARRNLVVAPTYLRQGSDSLIQAYRRSGDFETVGITNGKPFFSSLSVGLRQVPADLRRLMRGGKLGYQRETVAGTHYLVVGGPSGRGTELYFFFSEQNLRQLLEEVSR